MATTIFQSCIGSIGGILSAGLLLVLEIVAGLIALGILIKFVKKHIFTWTDAREKKHYGIL